MAGNSERIDDVVSPVALKQVDDLSKAVSDLEKRFIDTARAANDLNAATGNSRTFRDYNTNATAAAVQTAKLQQAQTNAARSAILLQSAQQRLDQQNLRTAASTQKAADAATKALSPYNALSKQLDIARTKAKDLYLQFGPNSEEFLRAQYGVNQLDARIKGIDSSLGQSQRNVGNYVRNVTASVTATGNPLGKFGEALSKAFGFIRIAAYALPGIGIAGIFGLLLDPIFDYIKSLDLLKQTLTEVQLRQDVFKRALASSDYSGAIESLDKLRINIDLANKGFIDKSSVIDEYNASIGKVAGNVDTLDEAEKGLVKNGPAFLQITRLKAAAQLALADAAKKTYEAQQIANQRLQEFGTKAEDIAAVNNKGNTLNTLFPVLFPKQDQQLAQQDTARSERQKKQVADTTAQSNKLLAIARKFQTDAAEIAKKNNFSGDLTGTGGGPSASETLKTKLQNQSLENDKINQKQIIDNDKKSYNERISAQIAFSNADKKILENNKNLELTNKTLSNNQKKAIDQEYNNAVLQATIDQNKQIQTLRDKQRVDSINDLKSQLQQQVANSKSISEDITKSLDDRLNASKDYEATSKKLIQLTADEEVKQAGNNTTKIITIRRDAQTQITNIETDGLKNRAAINKQAIDELKKIFQQGEKNQDEILKNSLNVVDQYTSQLKQDSQNSSDDQLQILSEQYAKGLIKAKDYQDRKKEIEGISKVNQDDIDIVGLQMQYSIRVSLGENTADIEKKLSDAKRKRDKDDTDNAISQYERDAAKATEVAERKKKLQDAIVKDADAATDLLKTIIDAGYQNQLNRVQDEKDALDDRTKAEIDAENRSTDSAATKADKIAVINAKAQAQQDQLDQKARAIKKKQAETDRLFAIAKIIETTAMAVISALAPPPLGLGPILGIPFAVAAGALGAIQIATVLATPIPAYEKGTDNAKGGISLVGEVGKEYVIEPSGKSYMTPDSPTLMNIPKGSKVISNMELMTMMANPNKQSYFGKSDNNAKMIEAINNGTNKTVKALRGNKSKRPIVFVDTAKIIKFNDHRNNHFR